MSAHVLPLEPLDTIGFSRLHALAARGYRPTLGTNKAQDGFAFVELSHPRTRGKNPPPQITLWSDGIISTRQMLWPQQYVPTEENGLPDWQRYIDQNDQHRFDRFASEVPKPTFVDIYAMPALRETKIFLARFVFGATLTVASAMLIQFACYR